MRLHPAPDQGLALREPLGNLKRKDRPGKRKRLPNSTPGSPSLSVFGDHERITSGTSCQESRRFGER